MPAPQTFLPLKPPVLSILLAMAKGPSHGYGIMLSVREQSGGTVDLGTSHLYRHLKKLLDLDLVEAVAPPEPDTDARRRSYGLTALGRKVLASEIARLDDLVAHARGLDLQQDAR